ncbi:hypothetical protein cyc_06099 [Cyclospora cayetanensis]|uniref:Uncharacterized protein n=1 Tax=Cyclospora cayetanensis TaxID=88456 RepID=A0A1D3D6H0_9EIME|nr:hypothetical protein cyc_06099 [Cyclospora cayetanensis]
MEPRGGNLCRDSASDESRSCAFELKIANRATLHHEMHCGGYRSYPRAPARLLCSYCSRDGVFRCWSSCCDAKDAAAALWLPKGAPTRGWNEGKRRRQRLVNGPSRTGLDLPTASTAVVATIATPARGVSGLKGMHGRQGSVEKCPRGSIEAQWSRATIALFEGDGSANSKARDRSCQRCRMQRLGDPRSWLPRGRLRKMLSYQLL